MSSLIRDLQRAFVLTLAVAASSTLSAATERNDSSVFRAKAVAIEYPPFLSPDLPGFGRSFVVLQQLLQQSETEEASSSETEAASSSVGCASNTFIGQQQADGSWKTVCKE